MKIQTQSSITYKNNGHVIIIRCNKYHVITIGFEGRQKRINEVFVSR